jgi:hypothetical protein
LILLKIQHRNVDRAVGQDHATCARIVDPPDLLEAEDILVEGSLLFRVLAGDREMLDTGHGLNSLLEVMGWK